MKNDTLNSQGVSNSPTSAERPEPESASFYKNRLRTFELRLDSLPRVSRLLFTLLLVYVLVGTYIDSEWWYTLLFEGGAFDLEHWKTGWDYLFNTFFWTVLLGAPLVLLFWWLVSPPKKRIVKRIWAKADLAGTRGFYLRLALLVLLILRLASINTSIMRERLDESLRVDQILAERLENPLSRPTSFVFLSKDTVDSLYGQYEPELVPSSVVEEIQNSNEIKAGANVHEFLKTEIGKNEFQRRLTEYRQSPKNSERKLADLLGFLLKKSLARPDYLKRFGDVEIESDEMRRLGAAIELLRTHNLSVDAKQLTVVRDRLLAEEIQRLVRQLKELRGLVLVEGDWSIEIQPNAYVFKRVFLNDVTGSPIFETKVGAGDISTQNREIIEGLKVEQMRLRIFGNVITGMHNESKIVRVNPIAIF